MFCFLKELLRDVDLLNVFLVVVFLFNFGILIVLDLFNYFFSVKLDLGMLGFFINDDF